MSRPFAIDLFCGLGGWSHGLIAEGYDVYGFDIERHEYDGEKYPGQLILQDVKTLHGSQFKGASIICASPPCQEFSYMAMPWKRGKQIARALRGEDDFPEGYTGSRTMGELTALFDACFRIQREASEAAGHHVPLIVENVRGARPWVGRAAANYGSFYLWGDVPVVMPRVVGRLKSVGNQNDMGALHGQSINKMRDAHKVPGFRFDGSGRSFQSEAVKVASLDGGRRTDIGKGARMTTRDCGLEAKGLKQGGDWFSDPESVSRTSSSKSPTRKAAAARIAKIPPTLAQWVAHWVPIRP